MYFSLCLGIQELKEKLYDLATKLPDPNNRTNRFIGRSIPKSYISLEASIKNTLKDKTEQKKQPFLDHEEFTEMINRIPNNDIDSADEVTQGMNGIRPRFEVPLHITLKNYTFCAFYIRFDFYFRNI